MHTPVSTRVFGIAVGTVACVSLMFIGLAASSSTFAPGSSQLAAAGSSWRSVLYPANWKPAKPDAQGRFLHDFSYAGYHLGEDPIPNNPPGSTYDVTQSPYTADKSGKEDATAAIQKAIDDAGAAGGGVVFLPKGTYKVSLQNSSDIGVLRIPHKRVVLRGAGAGQTFIYNTSVQMRDKAVIFIGTDDNSTLPPGGANAEPLTKNAALPTKVLQVADASRFAPGDWVVVSTNLTTELIQELGMTGKWDPMSFHWVRLLRQVVSVDQGAKTITIDIPTRYSMLMRDNARVRKMPAPPQEIGVERLAIGNRKHPGGGWDDAATTEPGTGAYEVDNAALIRVGYAANSWVRNVESYAPQGNGNIHMLSRGMLLEDGARSITVQAVAMRYPQHKGGAGNGTGFHVRGGENLFRNCEASNTRHNLEFWGPAATGNVFYSCTARGGELPSEFHGHFSAANLFDNTVLGDGEELVAENRTGKGSGPATHGLTTSQSVFWNTKGNGRVVSEQFKWGYVVGTASGVSASAPSGLGPADLLEGRGQGATLMPQSLYLDQLERRLSGEDPDTLPQEEPEKQTKTFDEPGTYEFVVPAHTKLEVKVWGGGGGGGSNANVAGVRGEAGGASSFGPNVVAQGGKGGLGGIRGKKVNGGVGGTGKGGDVSLNGKNGQAGTAAQAGDGGASPQGGAGGAGAPTPKNTDPVEGKAGKAPGGGGGGTAKKNGDNSFVNGGGGGGGAFVSKTYENLTEGDVITVVVGKGGAGSAQNADGGSGAPGKVEITWWQ